MKEETGRSRSIQDMLKSHRIPFIRVQCGRVKVKRGWMYLAEEGYPDIWTALGFLECKTPKGKLSDAQKRIHSQLRHWGLRVEVVQDAEEAKRVVSGWMRQREFERSMGW
jgi:hypothetical protein